MKKLAGLWLDHKNVFIVFAGEGAEETMRIESGVGQHVRHSGRSSSEAGPADDQRERQFTAHLNRYYDDVIAHLHNAESILLFGPGEAKDELRKRMVSKGLEGRIVGVETADKMTDSQIVAKVRQHYQTRLASSV